MRLSLTILIATVALILSSALTRGEKHGAVSPAPEGQGKGCEYRSRSGHFALHYPSDWANTPTKEYTLLLEHESTADAARVTVDVPYIPPHLPGMMTMKLVVNGYLDDLKKRLDDFSVVERSDDRLHGASAQRLVVTGAERAGDRRGEQRTIVALVAIRNEQVYILQADAKPDLLGAARDAMAKITDSWNWTK
jgi:hypothetical protein